MSTVAPQNPVGSPAVVSSSEQAQSYNADAEWTLLSDAMTEYDENMIQDWKDDLGNLLVFAGLFSGVVSGFALESYGWLQQDTSNQDVVVQLLAQISSQLASFSVSEGFVNSTIVPAPLDRLDDHSGPSELDVRINTLWFLSLATSLIASLLAIMVQQWLREYRVAGHVTVRERVRLRQYRFDALQDWGVPQIVSILPILLQIALTLFLVGLCYLLASLDKTVAKAFIAFVGIALSAYFAFTVLPIAFRRCPYKNSFAHGSVMVGKLALVIALTTVFIVGAGFLILLHTVRSFWTGLCGARESRFMVSLNKAIFAVIAIVPKLLDSHSDLGGREYWTARELDLLPKTKHLDQNALIWAPSGLSKLDLARMDRCLHELPLEDQMNCVCIWAAQTLNVSGFALGRASQDYSSAFDYEALAKIDNRFADRYRHSFLAAMPDLVVGKRDEIGFLESSILTILRHIARLHLEDADWTTAYARRVLHLRAAQIGENPIRTRTPWVRLPTACLFELSTIVQYEFNAEDVPALFDFADQVYDLLKFNEDDLVSLISCLDMMFGSYATALHAIYRQPALLEDQQLRLKCCKLLKALDRTVVEFKDHIVRQGMYGPDYFDSEGILLVTNPACTSLCKSIISLAQSDVLAFDDDFSFPILLNHVIEALQESSFEEGRDALSAFRASRQGPGVSVAAASELDVTPRNGSEDSTRKDTEIKEGAVEPLDSDESEVMLPEVGYEAATVNTETAYPDNKE